VTRPYIAVVRPLEPVAFEPMAGVGGTVQAELVLNLGVTREGGQVEVLQGLMNLFMQEGPVRRLMAQTTGEGMVSTLLEYLG
jgi:PTS system galactitol-specific IIA component